MSTTKPTLDDLLASSKPQSFDGDDISSNLVRQVSSSARAAAAAQRRPLWTKPPVLAGGVGLLFLATTAGAILTFDSNGLLIDGVQTPYDVIIPIEYTTSDGQLISCTAGTTFGSVDDADVSELKSFVQNHDWTGIGQRIHDEAVANPFVPGLNDDWEVDTQDLRDSASFDNASAKIFGEEIPDELTPDGTWSGTGSDCQGTL